MDTGSVQENSKQSLHLIQLPTEILELIFSYFCYDSISGLRQVCQMFNKIGCSRLNQGFNSISKQHAEIQKKIKSQLPRRESDRRKHPLAQRVDILSAIETRLSLLGMTYSKYIDLNVVCFIPGKVLDELQRILHIVSLSEETPRAHEFLQELRDISSMAMEHFEDKIVPNLKKNLNCHDWSFSLTCESCKSTDTGSYATTSAPVDVFLPPSTLSRYTVNTDMQSLKAQVQVQANCISFFKRNMSMLRAKVLNQSKHLVEYDKLLTDQRKITAEHKSEMCQLSKRLNILESASVTKSCMGPSHSKRVEDQRGHGGGSSSTMTSGAFRHAQNDEPSASYECRRSQRVKRGLKHDPDRDGNSSHSKKLRKY